MIPGLEYEQPEGASSYSAAQQSPSAQSMTSVEMSPGGGGYGYNGGNNNGNDNSYHTGQLHRRRPHGGDGGYGNGGYDNGGGSSHDEDKYAKRSRAVKRLDIFPKTERDYTVRTERGGQLTALGYVIMAILMVAEFLTWREMNGESLEHIVVDTR